MIFAIISMILLYLISGIFVWEFWTMLIISNYQSLNEQKFEKLYNIPLIIFLLLWPISIFIMLFIIYFTRK